MIPAWENSFKGQLPPRLGEETGSVFLSLPVSVLLQGASTSQSRYLSILYYSIVFIVQGRGPLIRVLLKQPAFRREFLFVSNRGKEEWWPHHQCSSPRKGSQNCLTHLFTDRQGKCQQVRLAPVAAGSCLVLPHPTCALHHSIRPLSRAKLQQKMRRQETRLLCVPPSKMCILPGPQSLISSF